MENLEDFLITFDYLLGKSRFSQFSPDPGTRISKEKFHDFPNSGGGGGGGGGGAAEFGKFQTFFFLMKASLTCRAMHLPKSRA